MKKIAILLALSMMLAGCTELEELVDDLDATYTTQDLDGIYHGMMLSMRVDMHTGDTYDLYVMQIMYCQETANEAQTDVVDMNDDLDASSTTTYVVVDEVCVAEETHVDADDELSYIGTLDASSNVPTLSIILSESTGYFVCDDGSEYETEVVNDGYDDCSNGEDEAVGAEDNIQTSTETVANAYLAADGYGMLVLVDEGMEDGASICLALSPTGMYDLTVEAVELLEAAEDDGVEIDLTDESTIPVDVAALFAVHEIAFALSPISTIAEGCEGQTFLYSALLAYIWATSLAGPEDDGGGDLMLYAFDASDATPTLTSAGEEELIYTSMTQGGDLSWASIKIHLSIDGGAYILCTQPGQTADTSCHVTDNGDAIWGVGEEITISEGSDDLCSGTCTLSFKVIDVQQDDKLIYESSNIDIQ